MMDMMMTMKRLGSMPMEFIYDGENRVQLLLNAVLIKMITDFEIPLQNQAVLDYIINHKEAAFRQIHTKGQI